MKSFTRNSTRRELSNDTKIALQLLFAIYILKKSLLRQMLNNGNSKYFTMQKYYIFQKLLLKKNPKSFKILL